MKGVLGHQLIWALKGIAKIFVFLGQKVVDFKKRMGTQL